jgi:ribonucleoside-diphosphate reductase beta chain
MGKMDFIKQSKSGLLIPSHSYKPFRYPWAFEFWKKQQQVHWMPEEVPLGEDYH